MRKLFMTATLLAFVLTTILMVGQNAFAKETWKKKGRENRIDVIDIPFWTPNRIGDHVANNGQIVSFLATGSAGLEWPVGSGNTAHFTGGIWIGGMKNGEIVTAAAEFSSEFQPGKVLPDGTAENSQDPRFHIYIINQPDIANPLGNPDYLNWPAADGAPVNPDGTPKLIGTSTIWAVFNDFNPTLHNNLFQTKVMGVEVQLTGWAFDRPDAFGDMLFFRFKIINKSGADIEQTYVGSWNDIDVGDALDLVGVDTTLSLGFNYKTQADGLYGPNPPATGIDFFQGPVVPSPGDTALVSGRKVPDFKNLPVTSFAKYINGGPPQLSDPENGPEMYNFMQGFDAFGGEIINPLTGEVTKFWHPGDPVAGTGWLDTEHKDKRFLMNSGPFTLAAGDTQEVVVGLLIAQGNTGVQSVALLKQADQLAQLAFDINFALPPSPESPKVTVSTEERALLLTWDSAQENYVANDPIDIDENGNATQYTFQGYNVYQLDAPVITDQTTVKKIATFDVIDGVVDIRDNVFVPSLGQTVNMVVQEAKDTGLQRFLRVDADAINGNAPLIQDRKYYFAVTAFGYNPFGIPRVLESSLQPFLVRPQSPPLGTDLSNTPTVGDTLAASRVSGGSDGGIVPIVIDRSALTGHNYEVRFRETAEGTVYDVVDVTTNEVKASGFKNQSDALGTTDYPVVDGVMVKVLGPALTFKNFETVANAAGPLDPPEGAAADFQGFPSARPTDRQQVGAGHWFIHTFDNGGSSGGGTRGSFEAFVSRVTNGGTRWGNIIPYDFEIRFTEQGGVGYDSFGHGDIYHVPYELWRIGVGTPDDPSDDVRMCPYTIDWDEDRTFNMSNWGPGSDPANCGGICEHSASGGDDDPYTDTFYWAFPDDATPGDAGYKAWEAAGLAMPPSPVSGLPSDAGPDGVTTQSFFNVLAKENTIRRMSLVNWNGGVTPPFNQEIPETGTIFRITTTKPNTPEDVFSFSSVAPVRNNLTLAKQQAKDLVNVYPNPYHGFNIEETDPTNRFVTFINLPEGNAKIQIFTLAGELVATIDHTNGTKFEQWDLRNNDDIPVASGIYIARVDMGSIGVKILKIAVLQPEERLDVF